MHFIFTHVWELPKEVIFRGNDCRSLCDLLGRITWNSSSFNLSSSFLWGAHERRRAHFVVVFLFLVHCTRRSRCFDDNIRCPIYERILNTLSRKNETTYKHCSISLEAVCLLVLSQHSGDICMLIMTLKVADESGQKIIDWYV